MQLMPAGEVQNGQRERGRRTNSSHKNKKEEEEELTSAKGRRGGEEINKVYLGFLVPS